jgi:ferredoxin-thioredoxin reductase catalytic subunit
VYAEQDIAEYGRCYCSLFFDPTWDFNSEETASIPERRPEELFPS